jgi:hypothetical protein
MYPHERSLVNRLKDKPFVLFGINTGDEKSLLRKLIKDGEVTWPFWIDDTGKNGPITQQWAVEAFPTIYVLDAKGVIRFKDVREEEMDQAVDKLLAELEEETKKSES